MEEDRRSMDDGMGGAAYNRPESRHHPSPQAPRIMNPNQSRMPQPGNVVRPPAFQNVPKEEEEPQKSIREMIFDFLPTSVKIAGWGGIVFSGIATTIFIYTLTGQFFTQPAIQGAIGVAIAVIIFFAQATAVSTPNKVGSDVYWIVVGIDTFFTATLSHNFTMQVVQVYPLVPVVLMAASTYIGFRVTQRKWSTFQSAMTAIGIAAFLIIGQGVAGYYGNAQAFIYVMFAIDLVGNFWVSRLGEEAALGRRLVWN